MASASSSASADVGSTCTRCEARNNYMHDWLGTVQDSSGVCLYQTTTYCTVEGNKLYATGNEGVLHQDPYTSSLPQHNNIIDNKIKDQIGYGIAVYQPAGGNVYCLIRGNDIQNISGTIPTNPDSGNGVYIAGCGGVSVIGNTIRNCCISTNTATRSLAPAAIGINGVAAGMIQPIVSDNLISEMPTLDGILITSSPGGGIICDNTILQAVGNTGGTPIRVEASSNVQISGNSVNNLSTGVCIYLYANGVSMTNISVSGGALLGGNTAQIRCSRNGAFSISNLTISGVVMRSIGTTGTGSIVFDTSVVTSALVVGNGIEANTVPALYLSAATNVRVAANVLSSTGTNAVTTTGTCTGGSLDRSNKLTGLVNNGGTAFVVEQYATAAPGTGTAAVGDRLRLPVVQPAAQPDRAAERRAAPGLCRREPGRASRAGAARPAREIPRASYLACLDRPLHARDARTRARAGQLRADARRARMAGARKIRGEGGGASLLRRTGSDRAGGICAALCGQGHAARCVRRRPPRALPRDRRRRRGASP